MCQLNINYMNKPQISAQQLKRSISFQYQFCSWMCKTGNYNPQREVRFCSTQSRRTQADRGPALQAIQGYQGCSRCRKYQEVANITSGHISLARIWSQGLMQLQRKLGSVVSGRRWLVKQLSACGREPRYLVDRE